MKPTKGAKNGFSHENRLHAVQGNSLDLDHYGLCSRCRTSTDPYDQDGQEIPSRTREDDDLEAGCCTQEVV